MNIYLAVSTIIAFSLSTTVVAQDKSLEQGLLTSMSIFINKEGSIERSESSGEAIQSYMTQRYIDKHPNFRYDYTDYYLLNKPALLLGHDLKVIEEEYPSQYIGCCVSPGVGAVVRQKGSLNSLQAFAQKNRCSIEPIEFNAYLKKLNFKNLTVPKGRYYSISCRERELYGE